MLRASRSRSARARQSSKCAARATSTPCASQTQTRQTSSSSHCHQVTPCQAWTQRATCLLQLSCLHAWCQSQAAVRC
eukprot:jgi/Astpho2/5714/e_gw1.00079.224.1_t